MLDCSRLSLVLESPDASVGHGVLQDVGLVREVRAAKKPGCPVCGPRGDAYATGETATFRCLHGCLLHWLPTAE
jgi:hypothetical protein